MKRVLSFLCGAALAGCATVVPMQTASVVDPGHLRAGGQVTVAGWCGAWADGLIGAYNCTEFPDGVPMPELRLNGRYGLGHGLDIGASAQVAIQVMAPERALQVGLEVDVKLEVMRLPMARGPTHILSVGLLGGLALSGRFGLDTWAQAEWGVPLFYGLQFEKWEVVAGTQVSLRHTEAPGFGASSRQHRVGFSLGLFRRQPSGFALQVSYLTRPEAFDSGVVQLQIGAFFDVL